MNKTELKRQARLLPGYLVLVVWLIFTVIMVGWVFMASLSTTKEIFAGDVGKFPTGLHFENYKKAWTVGNISKFTLNSFIYATTATVLILAISAPAAYVLSRYKFALNGFIKQAFVIAQSVPIVLIILPLFGIVTRLGIMKHDWSIMLLMIFLYTGTKIPYTVIFLLSFFRTISTSFEEAAIIDGCSRKKAFWKVVFPLAQSGLITVSVFNFISIWNEYFITLIFASKTSVRNVAVGLYSMISTMKYTGDWAGLFASVILVFLPTFILYIVLSNRILDGITQGGVKG